MKSPSELPVALHRALDSLQPVPPRDAARAAQGKAEFLQRAAELAKETGWAQISSQQAVSLPANRRHKQWIDPITQIFQRPFGLNKERNPMMTTIATILVVASLLLGSGGAVVVASQGSMPDQPLYSVKTWSEQTRADWTVDPQAQVRLALELAERRADEAGAMLDEGKTPPLAVQEQLRTQLDLALQIAAGQPETDAVHELLQIRERVHQIEQTLGQPAADPDGGQTREQLRTMLQERLKLCDTGLEDPLKLQEQLRHGTPSDPGPADPQPKGPGSDRQGPQQPDPKGSATGTQVGPGGNPGGTQDPDAEKGNQAGPHEDKGQNPWTEGTPTPGSSYGPGESNNPWTDTTPTPGSSYGPGPGDGSGAPDPQHTPECSDCSGPGPQPPEDGGGDGGGQHEPEPEPEHGGGGGGGGGGRP